MRNVMISAICIGLLACYAEANAVFAHFMVGNTAHYTQGTWETEMSLAQGSRIDAFALNVAAAESMNEDQIGFAFKAAQARGFNSTFEGPDHVHEWNDIKRQFNCFFVPDWSSKGAAIAVGLSDGVADGLFNWAAWPDCGSKDTYVDASYKNWLWRGEALWYERWVQALHVQPEWIQISSWNDYGESHYIAHIRGDASLIALDAKYGQAPFNYVRGIEHGAWRAFLPYLIEFYRSGTASVSQEGLTVWYRLQPRPAGCNDGGTTSFTATRMQPEEGYFNFNPIVYGLMGPGISPRSPPMKIDKDTPCIKGTGIGDFKKLCENACSFNYCPIEACMCTQWGKDRGVGLVRGRPGYPAAGRDSNFEGLRAVTCSYGIVGVCPADKTSVVSDQKALDQICAFGCKHGYCPSALCTCDTIGRLLLPEPTTFTGEKPGFRSV
ncbi:hypothetical protein ST47_g4999 [Ascochyta rabiei]|uniref:Hydrolase n=1 Tax=Didymella rabiei TaxID=5454 RepID=A0A163EQ04_DIDRA|nr:hypothetical protein ST47_g4999 [Ascochyta rabiei]